MYQWIKGNVYKLVVTMTDSSITLNNSAANYFSDVRWCLIGIDNDQYKLAIKPVSKADVDLKLYSLEDLHKISIGNGYARISNKSLMSSIAELVREPLSNSKFTASWDEKNNMLVVDLAV